jgi:hypothetical protein
VLADIVADKSDDEPLVINMSLGFMPKLEHIPWMWYGVEYPNEDFVNDAPIPGEPPRDRRWLAEHTREVEQTAQLLHGGLEQLARYLLENNILGVAAAGNDSQKRVEAGRPRLGPRIPARYRSILGVGATTRDPAQAAIYSNVGDEYELGDHISTFGGDMDPHTREPRDGVIGVYTAPTFPRGKNTPALENTSGWAAWSGTSFATGIASGLVANYWAVRSAERPDTPAERVLEEFNDVAHGYVPALRTRSVGMRGEWVAC